jgi:hypothetical protein
MNNPSNSNNYDSYETKENFLQPPYATDVAQQQPTEEWFQLPKIIEWLAQNVFPAFEGTEETVGSHKIIQFLNQTPEQTFYQTQRTGANVDYETIQHCLGILRWCSQNNPYQFEQFLQGFDLATQRQIPAQETRYQTPSSNLEDAQEATRWTHEHYFPITDQQKIIRSEAFQWLIGARPEEVVCYLQEFGQSPNQKDIELVQQIFNNQELYESAAGEVMGTNGENTERVLDEISNAGNPTNLITPQTAEKKVQHWMNAKLFPATDLITSRQEAIKWFVESAPSNTASYLSENGKNTTEVEVTEVLKEFMTLSEAAYQQFLSKNSDSQTPTTIPQPLPSETQPVQKTQGSGQQF